MNPLPACLQKATNRPVLNYLSGLSAHSEVADVLTQAIAPLGAARTYCPDSASYKYLCVYADGSLFGYAVGMNTIAFRLSPTHRRNAIATGGTPIDELGDEWVALELFRSNWPEVDVKFWARKAYLFAIGADDS